MDDAIIIIEQKINELIEQYNYANRLVEEFSNAHNTIGMAKSIKACKKVSNELDEAIAIEEALRQAQDIIADCWVKHKNMMNEVGIDL